MISVIVINFIILLASAAAESPSLKPRTTYATASFVSSAAPALVSRRGYGPYHAVSKSSSLFAKKKKSGGGQPASKKGKVQVMLLETVSNIGQTGDIVSVSSAVFQNQLQLSNKARLISKEEVEKMEREEKEQEVKMAYMAMKSKNILEEAMLENLGGEEQCDADGDICGVALTMKRRASPEGNLFGKVNPKMIMEALKEEFPEGGWDGRQVKLRDVKDSDGNDVKKKDIKHIGDYTLNLALHPSVDVTFILSVVSE